MLKNKKRIHLVNLFKWRSIVATFACLVTIFFTSFSVLYAIKTAPIENALRQHEWFTIDSNSLAALAALMILPYAIDGIFKKRFIYPKWMQIIHFQGTLSTTITHVFVVCFASWFDPGAFVEENFVLHVICPFAVLISFFMVESNYPITKRDNLLGLIPFCIYSIFYLVNVVFLHTWKDRYMLNTFVPFYVSMPLMYLLAYLIGYGIRYIHNRLLTYRDNKMKMIWNEDLDPVTVKIEIYSLGYHAGLYQSKSDVSIPFDILQEVSNRFNIKIEELARAFTKGAIDGLKDKTNK